jgi:nickel transport protein
MFLFAEQAAAHSVHIFAWVQGSNICTRSYFSKSNPVIHGAVRMEDSQGSALAEGTSDDSGRLCFSLPQDARDLLFTVNAGQGHKGSYLLPASELRQASADPRQHPQAASSAPALPAAVAGNSTGHTSMAGADAFVNEGQGLSASAREEVLDMIRRECAPLSRAPAEQLNDGSPRMRDILGGLGWIFGLTAAGILYYKRKRQ